MSLLLINASPAPRSRAGALLDSARRELLRRGEVVRQLRLATLPATGLLAGSADDVAIRLAVLAVEQAEAVVLATPLVRASYSGLLKVFLDLLPQTSLAGKSVLPLATGSSPVQMLALDYALRPVLQSVAAQQILPGVYGVDEHIALMPEQAAAVVHPELEARLIEGLDNLLEEVRISSGGAAAQARSRSLAGLRFSV